MKIFYYVSIRDETDSSSSAEVMNSWSDTTSSYVYILSCLNTGTALSLHILVLQN